MAISLVTGLAVAGVVGLFDLPVYRWTAFKVAFVVTLIACAIVSEMSE